MWGVGARIIFEVKKLPEIILMLKGALAMAERSAIENNVNVNVKKIRCPACNGTGQIMKRTNVYVCTKCSGSGKIIAPDNYKEDDDSEEEIQQNPIPQLLDLEEGGHVTVKGEEGEVTNIGNTSNTSIISGQPAEINTGISPENLDNETDRTFSDN
jgi:ribosomal protein L37AE/L43A